MTIICRQVLDAFSPLYKRLCPYIGLSVTRKLNFCEMGWNGTKLHQKHKTMPYKKRSKVTLGGRTLERTWCLNSVRLVHSRKWLDPSTWLFTRSRNSWNKRDRSSVSRWILSKRVRWPWSNRKGARASHQRPAPPRQNRIPDQAEVAAWTIWAAQVSFFPVFYCGFTSLTLFVRVCFSVPLLKTNPVTVFFLMSALPQ